jgi:hypothetical protein
MPAFPASNLVCPRTHLHKAYCCALPSKPSANPNTGHLATSVPDASRMPHNISHLHLTVGIWVPRKVPKLMISANNTFWLSFGPSHRVSALLLLHCEDVQSRMCICISGKRSMICCKIGTRGSPACQRHADIGTPPQLHRPFPRPLKEFSAAAALS